MNKLPPRCCKHPGARPDLSRRSDMSRVFDAPARVQVSYSTTAGPLVREDGHTRPISLDQLESRFGLPAFERCMERPGGWLDLTLPPDADLRLIINGVDYRIDF